MATSGKPPTYNKMPCTRAAPTPLGRDQPVSRYACAMRSMRACHQGRPVVLKTWSVTERCSQTLPLVGRTATGSLGGPLLGADTGASTGLRGRVYNNITSKRLWACAADLDCLCMLPQAAQREVRLINMILRPQACTVRSDARIMGIHKTLSLAGVRTRMTSGPAAALHDLMYASNCSRKSVQPLHQSHQPTTFR
jgi:hypothetical protein